MDIVALTYVLLTLGPDDWDPGGCDEGGALDDGGGGPFDGGPFSRSDICP